MALFKLNELHSDPNPSISKTITGKNSFAIGRKGEKIEKTIGTVSPGETMHFVSMSDWSTHDLLFHFLKQTGRAEVFFTTWAISEFAVRQLHSYVKSGMISRLSGIFDYRNGIHKPAEVQFLRQITTNIKPGKCHAKVAVILNKDWGISIVTSGNFTRNPRIEAGTITNDKAVAEFHRSWIISELSNTSQFDKLD